MSEERVVAGERSSVPLSYSGYHRKQDVAPDLYLCQVTRGTPGGEYQRRFWHPIAYLHELDELPLKARALGEDLVVFKDKSGAVGALHLHCCHRNTSLEYGVIEEHGIRCCYHGRVFDVDGKMIEVPGDPQGARLMNSVSQGAYPTHVMGGIVFVYMGPPDKVPAFPMLDRFDLPGQKLVPGVRFPMACNWLQVKENAMDAHHTEILHVMVPALRGTEQFSTAFSKSPELTWVETPGGMVYLAARKVGDNVWVRTTEIFGQNFHCLSSVAEKGDKTKKASAPFLSLWTLPVDDDHTINFFVSHVQGDDHFPFEKRRAMEIFGQTAERPYRERQWLPGDHDAMESQGPINIHALEHLGTFDRGISMFRRYVRRGIQAVEKGEEPHGFYARPADVPPSYANDYIANAKEAGVNADDPAALRDFAQKVVTGYRDEPPMAELSRELAQKFA